MSYSVMKALQFVLFFGPVIVFCLWQIRAMNKLRANKNGNDENGGPAA